MDEQVVPGRGTSRGPHHEIYLGDPRTVDTAGFGTVLRHAVARRG